MRLLAKILIIICLTTGWPHIQAQDECETYTVFTPTDSTDHYSNGVVMTAFKDVLYCMWQSSPTDEDSDDTWVAYSRSTDDGKTWSKPLPLALPTATTYCTSGGWLVRGDTLTAFIDVWEKDADPRGGSTYFICSTDGLTWTQPQPVMMADGTTMNGVLEQDPYTLPDGRLIGACHFQPGLHVCPVYTDDPTGWGGWKKGFFECEDRGKQSRCLEPSQYLRPDGTIVMLFRDQASTFRKMFSISHNRGLSWSKPSVTTIPDARTKQCAGNIPGVRTQQYSRRVQDIGPAFMVSCPMDNKQRWPLVLHISSDGIVFDRTLLLRSGAADDLPPRRYEGKAKTLGYNYPKAFTYNGYLYVSYSVNKELVQYTRITLPS